MAFAGGCAGTVKNTVGYDYSISAMYLSEQCRGLPPISEKGTVKPGALRKRFGGESLFSPIFKRGLFKDCCGKSCIKYGVPDAAA